MDCCLPGSSVHEISQSRLLEWVAISFSRGYSQPRDRTCISWGSCIASRFFMAEFRLPVPFVANMYTAWFPLLSPRSSVLRATEILPPGLKVLDITTKKDSCLFIGLPWWLSGKESACQHRIHRFNPWVRKILWRREWQPTPVFLPGDFHGQRNLAGYSLWVAKSQIWLTNTSTFTTMFQAT